ncbi:hypothetical protein [Picosynechococcus sp. NKBG042902]|uniref:hypothetical protein n=1 Tax=Picosynechococcus sp. NKBG042902 TaxID=490193 RepID=UPI000693442B|nr:hypothetical protein [Picosynechococcus sp. NKBG042902]
MSSNFFQLHSLGGEPVKTVYSSYIPFITFVDPEKVEKSEQYILKEAEDFFLKILGLPNVPELIDYQKTLNWKDFHKVPFKYFYDVIFCDFYERNREGKLINKLKWAITFDEELTPIQVASIRRDLNATNQEGVKRDFFDRRRNRVRPHYRNHNPYPPYRKYGYISISGEPVLYYLHFTLQEILDALKL